jgi:NRPS condensation-like uncharacterized protein
MIGEGLKIVKSANHFHLRMDSSVRNPYNIHNWTSMNSDLLEMKLVKEPSIIKAETLDIMQFFYRSTQDPLVRCFVRLDGHIDETALMAAITSTAETIPFIFCRFNMSVKRPHWQRDCYKAEDIVKIIDSGEDAEAIAAVQLTATIDIFHEPQLKIIIVRDKQSDRLCIIMNHMVCDGGGFKEYLYLLSDLYNRCKGGLGHQADAVVTSRSTEQLFSRFTLMEKLHILFSRDELGKQKNGLVYRLQGDSNQPFIVTRPIPEARFLSIKARAKSLGATVNDMVLTSYMRALSNVTGQTTITIPCPVDLRKYLLPGSSSICNLTSNLICEVQIDKSEPFDTTLVKVAGEMEKQKSSKACLKGIMLLEILSRVLPFGVLQKNFNKFFTIPVTSYTNLGVIDKKLFRFDGVVITDAYLTGAIKVVPYFQVSVSTYNNCCTLSCNLHGTQQDRACIERFLEWMDKELLPGDAKTGVR